MNGFFCGQVGATVLTVGLSGAVQFLPQAGQIGWRLKVLAGGGSGIAFMQSANGLTASQGYILGTESFDIQGPATFFLAAQGTTGLVSALTYYGAGYSLKPVT